MTSQKMQRDMAAGKTQRPKVTHHGHFELLPSVPFECAVLEDGRRGLILREMVQSIGFGGSNRGARFHRFCGRIGLNQLTNLEESESPFLQVDLPHGGVATWVPDETLSDVVRAGLVAHQQGRLTKHQEHIGRRCTELGTALIGVGLTSLIDEATGYQYVRAPDALQDLLSRLIRRSARDWDRRFPADYYRAICGLWGFRYEGVHRPLPAVVGQVTERWVYLAVFPKELVAEIKTRRRSEKLHQWLTEQDGMKLLERQIAAVTTIARSAIDYRDFEARCMKAFARPGQQLSIILPQVA